MKRVQVAVVGAGPVGAFAAYRLALRGVHVALIDRETTPPEDMRASTMHAPTLDMLAELGLLDTLLAEGLKAPVYQYRNHVTGEIFAFDLGDVADVLKHPYRLQCEQFRLTRLVVKLLENFPNAEVMLGHRALSVQQDADGVDLALETPMAIERLRADYVIGADGANSTIRKWLGVEFSGFTYPERFLTFSTAWPMERHFENLANVSYIVNGAAWGALVRVANYWRLLVPSPNEGAESDLLSDAKKTAVFDELIGEGEGVQTHHRTLYRVHQRVAETFNVGRVALVGDAAHLNNPLGGFGMNSGIHDAWNLTAKLLDILQDGRAADAALDLYTRQRRTIAREFVQEQTIRNKNALEASGAEAQRKAQEQMSATLADPDLYRAYLLKQSMHAAMRQEATIT